MNKTISQFIDKNPDWATLLALIVLFKFFYDSLIYIFKDYKKDKDSYNYSSAWVGILGYITLFIMWLIFLSNRLKE